MNDPTLADFEDGHGGGRQYLHSDRAGVPTPVHFRLLQPSPEDVGPGADYWHPDYTRPSDLFWSLFIRKAVDEDRHNMEHWKGDADGILIFTGLFAATVATFVVSTIPSMSSDTGKETTVLLAQIIAVLSNNTDARSMATIPTSDFQPSQSAVWTNTLWLISLFVSLFCALGATLVQQWIRQYRRDVSVHSQPSIRGPVYAGLALGMILEDFRDGNEVDLRNDSGSSQGDRALCSMGAITLAR
ncbi:hypothetical protein PENSPDRAFT_686948 [Peniophora sp. CONT]|nr:hypothetical protein PENSPDRAFT_686948 [Peniophora sp. CONT]